MSDTSSTQHLKDLSPLSSKEAVKIKLAFKENIEKQLNKVITDDMSKSYIHALRKHLIICTLNRYKINTETLKDLIALDEETTRKRTKSIAEPLFSPNQRKDTKIAAKHRYKNHGHGLLGTGQRRLYFPLIASDKASKTEQKVESYLSKNGYTIQDYKEGYATDEKGKQTYKIGKLLKEDDYLKQLFINDGSRISGQQYFVLSDYANDIVHMSTRRGWRSCMSHDGSHNIYLTDDIEGGTLVGYLIRKNDPYIFDPLARVLFKPLHNENGETKYHANNAYGLCHEVFEETAERIAKQISTTGYGLFKVPDAIYNDGAPSQILSTPDNMTAEEFLDMLNIMYGKDKSGKIIIHGDLNITHLGIETLPDLTNVIVKGDFYCYSNRLTSLIGCPQEVGGEFGCGNNQLTSLDGAPKKIGGSFYCNSNKLTSLIGVPEEIMGTLFCRDNLLTSLIGAPKIINGSIYCNSNQLTSLEGAPDIINGTVNCSNNQITSLKGLPKEIMGGFFCEENLLTSLTGAPEKISGSFGCKGNNLTSLAGIPLNFTYLDSDLGDFEHYDEIRAELLEVKTKTDAQTHNNKIRSPSP